MKALLALPFLILPALAHADQCAVVEAKVAARALAVLRTNHPLVIDYCEPCHDPAPSAPHRIDSVSTGWHEAGETQLEINQRDVDLVYVYVQTAAFRYDNLAVLAGCPVGDVSPALIVSGATDTGVMITASTPPAARIPLEVAAVPAPVAIVTHVVHHDGLGLLVVLAGLASAGLWAAAAILILLRRPRGATVPRAVAWIDRS